MKRPVQFKAYTAFTLVELLVVVSIIAIIVLIATVNLTLAFNRSLKSAGAADLHAIGAALQAYYVDYGDLPPGDREAGPFMSHASEFVEVGNGPAGGGSWDGLPWLLYEYGYVEDWKVLFSPKYLRLYSGPPTIRGEHPRYHNFRYAYNSSGLSTGGHLGGDGNIMSGTEWLVRDLFLPPRKGWYAEQYPMYPADYTFPWGEGEDSGKAEHVLYSDMAVRTEVIED